MRKLCWCCAAFSLGAALGVLVLPGERLFAAALVVLGLGAVISVALRGVKRRCAFLFSLLVALGLVRCALQYVRVAAPAEELSGSERQITGRVLEYPQQYEDYACVYVRLLREGVDTRCQLHIGGTLTGELRPGDEIRVNASLASARYRYGEESDSAASRGIFLRAYAEEMPEVTGRWALSWLYAPRTLSRAIGERVKALFPADCAAFIAALLTGDKTALYRDYDTYYSLSRAGLMHVAAVSGMHVSFLVGALLLLVPNRRRCALLAIPVLLVFMALTGFTPSVCRAVFMQLCLLLAPLAGRQGDAPTALSLVLALLLLLNPWAVASVSLQLSFAATAGILWLGGRIYRHLCGSGRSLAARVRKWAAASVASSVGALVFTLPLMALHFGSISVIAPLTNALCLWMVSFLFVGGYVCVGLFALLPALGRVLAMPLVWGCRYVFFVCGVLGKLPAAVVYTANPVYIAWLSLVYLLFALAWWSRRRGKGVGMLVPLCLSLITLWSAYLATALLRGQELRVSVLDVGQGACTVLECGDDCVMVDCGSTNTLGYPGQDEAYYFLAQSRRKLSALILTHLHRDHVNGVERLMALVEVETLYLPETVEENAETLSRVLAAAAKGGTEVVFVREDMRLTGEHMVVDIKAPMERTLGEESSLIACASRNGFDVLITGDATASQERRYAWEEARDIELLVVSHHGSDTSTDERFLRSMTPEAAVISVGYNTYGHPSGQTLERLRAQGIEIHRTDEEGNVIFMGGEE